MHAANLQDRPIGPRRSWARVIQLLSTSELHVGSRRLGGRQDSHDYPRLVVPEAARNGSLQPALAIDESTCFVRSSARVGIDFRELTYGWDYGKGEERLGRSLEGEHSHCLQSTLTSAEVQTPALPAHLFGARYLQLYWSVPTRP